MGESQVDWRNIVVRAGDWTCPIHGIIQPAMDGLVPYCGGWVGDRQCMRIAIEAVDRAGKLVHVEPAPEFCDGPGRHRLRPRAVLVGTRPCRCTPAGSHRTWLCLACPDGTEPMQWPSHDPDGIG